MSYSNGTATSGAPLPGACKDGILVSLVILVGLFCGTVAGVVWTFMPGGVGALRAVTRTPVAAPVEQPKQQKGSLTAGPALLQRVTYHSEAGRARVAIDLQSMVRYEAHSLHNPERVFLDLYGTRVAPQMAHKITVGEGGLRSIRLAQHESQTSRIVLDLSNRSSYSIARRDDPPRLMIDVTPPSD
jgi:N-acetylmuramoyl-L-alanine amidase